MLQTDDRNLDPVQFGCVPRAKALFEFDARDLCQNLNPHGWMSKVNALDVFDKQFGFHGFESEIVKGLSYTRPLARLSPFGVDFEDFRRSEGDKSNSCNAGTSKNARVKTYPLFKRQSFWHSAVDHVSARHNPQK